jgi:hypothetical protein
MAAPHASAGSAQRVLHRSIDGASQDRDRELKTGRFPSIAAPPLLLAGQRAPGPEPSHAKALSYG